MRCVWVCTYRRERISTCVKIFTNSKHKTNTVCRFCGFRYAGESSRCPQSRPRSQYNMFFGFISSLLLSKYTEKRRDEKRNRIMADSAAPAASPKKVAKKPSKPKAPAAHPPVQQMVHAAIAALKERRGSSLAAIKKYIAANYKVDIVRLAPFIRKCLKKGVTDGKLVQVKGTGASGSFRLSPAAKKEPKKPKAKKPKVKKPTKPKKAKKPKAKKPKAKKAATPKKAKKPKTPKAKKPAAKKPATKKPAAKKPKAKKPAAKKPTKK